MNITKEETGKLTATIKIEVVSEDYSEQVEKTLREQQKKAAMHGFRPGKVPYGLIKKIYGKAILLDEINHLLSDNLNKYIQDNSLNIIGNPLPAREKTDELDLDNNTDFEFFFDIGMAPEFTVMADDKLSVEYFDIKVNDKMVDEYIHDLQHRFSDHPHDEHEHDHSEEGHEEHHHEPAELNAEFFNKVFPGQEIKDEKAFREKVKEGMEASLVGESDRYFMNTAIEKLVSSTEMELPESFLKKWMKEGGEKELSDEQVESQYENFARSLRWQMIESRLIHEHNLKVEEIEMKDFVKEYFMGRMIVSAEDSEANERLDMIASSVLSNKEEANRIHDQLFDRKMMDFFKNNLKLNHKKIDYDDFVKMVTEKQAK
jgi:FKBP-type peptidyl-prolyl cis-trans isomerase (trigger factor)